MPLTKQQKAAYQKAFDAALKNAQTVPDQSARQLLTTLRDYRTRIVAQIADAGGWNAYWLPQLETAITETITELETTLKTRMGGLIDDAWNRGVALVDESFVAMNVMAPSIGMDIATLTMAQELSGGLITKLNSDLSNDIMTQVRLGIMAEKPQMQVIKEIGRILVMSGVKQPAGTFGKVATRAEAIARTETMRVLNGGHRARAESLAEEFPEMRKYWVATYDARARENHVAVDSETNPAHGGTPIPVKQKFQVGKYEPTGPHDPVLGAEESVFCRCTLRTTMLDDSELKELYPDAKPPALPTVKKKAVKEIEPAETARNKIIDIYEKEQVKIARLERLSENNRQKMIKELEKYEKTKEDRFMIKAAEYENKHWNYHKQFEKLKYSLDGKLRKQLYVNDKGFEIKTKIESFGAGAEFFNNIVKGSIDEFSKLIDSKILPIKKVGIRQIRLADRPFYTKNIICSSSAYGPKTIIHEAGHWLEDSSKTVRDKVIKFFDDRTKGESAVWLGDNYNLKERTKKDKFVNPYMGKVYRDSSEIVSMGLEYFYDNPYELAKKDPGYFNFIYNLVRGR